MATPDFPAPLDAVLLTCVQVSTYAGWNLLTRGSSFFFARGGRRFLVTSRHVLFDKPTGHLPDRIEFNLHASESNLAHVTTCSLPLYADGKAVWRQAQDAAGEIDVAVIELPDALIPAGAVLHCFTPDHLAQPGERIPVGTNLLLVGFPLGFHDTVYRLPVARHAIVASAFGVRFQSQGYFLTDARAHRGSSGSPVVMASPAMGGPLPWKLLGVHSSRMDMNNRDFVLDESLGLNCAWYSDVLMTLTAPAP